MSTSEGVRNQYKILCGKLTEISHLRGISALLDWDQQVMMPPGAAESRGKQASILEGLIHEKQTSENLRELIYGLYVNTESPSVLNEYEWANVRDAKRNYDMTARIPKEIAQRAAELTIDGQTTWSKAYKEDKWELFAPVLKEWIQLRKTICKHIDPERHPYDVCLDTFERGMTAKKLDVIFQELKPPLVKLIQKISEKKTLKASEKKLLKDKKFEISKQVELCNSLAKDIGFNTECGRLDVSVHPFTGGANFTDVRMTTRYKENDITEGLTGTIHETGHALYEQGKNKEHAFLPVAEALSMGIHESQSLFWERMIGLSNNFWKFFQPKLTEKFSENFPGEIISENLWEKIYEEINEVKPDLIRVEADELTYPLHIILRYELERGIFSDEISVENLPKIWNQKMKEYLGVDVPSNSKGVLQDVHWSVGAFGYFPSYSLGAIYACQFYVQAEREIPSLAEKITQGDFNTLRQWLAETIHRKGSLYDSGEKLVKEITGKEVDVNGFLTYLENKYSKIYKL